MATQRGYRLMRLVAILVALVPAAAPAPSLAQNSAARSEIESRIADLLTAYRNGDTRGVTQMFTDDASILGPGGLRVVGRAAIDSYWVARPRPTSWEIETLEVGGSAAAPWQYARSIRINRTATGADTSITTFIIVWKRAPDGNLRIYLDLFT